MLSRVPFWGWLIIILSACYLLYNPSGMSIWHMWALGDPTTFLPFKILATLLVATVLGLIVHGTLKSVSWFGMVTMWVVVAVVLWSLHALIMFDVTSQNLWAWIIQPIIAVILTVGWQWPKIWRGCTGVVSVTDPDTPA